MTGVFKTDAMARDISTRTTTENPDGFAERKVLAMQSRIAGALGSLPRFLARSALGLALLPALGGAALAQKQTSIMDTEFFEVALVHSYTEIWRDSGSGADRDVFILRPNLPPGFRALGDVAIEGKVEDFGVEKFPYTLAIKPKPGRENLIAEPTGRVQAWSTAGSDANVRIKVFAVTCPKGFFALGGYVELETNPRPNENIVCISKSILAPGVWAQSSVWDDKGTGADTDLSLWNAEYRAQPVAGTLTFPSNAFFPSSTHQQPKDKAYVLQLTQAIQNPLVGLDKSQVKSILPTLIAPGLPQMGGALDPIEYQLPFYQVQDPELTFFEQWLESPTYTVRRTGEFTLIGTRDNTPNCALGEASTFTYKTTTGVETSVHWNVNASVAVSLEAGIAFAPFGVGAESKLTITGTVGGGREWGTTETKATVRVSRDVGQ